MVYNRPQPNAANEIAPPTDWTPKGAPVPKLALADIKNAESPIITPTLADVLVTPMAGNEDVTMEQSVTSEAKANAGEP